MVLEIHMKLCVTAGFSWKKFFAQKFLLNLFYNDNLYYLLCSCTNPIFGKILLPEIWSQMFSANQIAEIFKQPQLQNKSMK